MKKLILVIGALLILGLSAPSYAGVSVGFVIQVVPEPYPIPPPAYGYTYLYPYSYSVPAPYYAPPRYYAPRVYAPPPPAPFNFRFGFDGHERYGRHFEQRWR
jgi:hypothetical protein